MFAQRTTSAASSLVYLLPNHADFVLRHVQASDIASLQENCFTDYDVSLVKDLVARVQHLNRRQRGIGMVIVQRSTQQIVGYGQVVRWGDKAEISDLMVAERLRGRGLGTELIRHLINSARRLNIKSLEIGVATSNGDAHRLYQRLGFVDAYSTFLRLGGEMEKVIFLQMPMTICASL
ncbi:MAG: GNAT family N-acetyltransferase [Anaerolineae bacterium]|nr:GNAT family N-acetyltransferase [Anaerolineae bacterium]